MRLPRKESSKVEEILWVTFACLDSVAEAEGGPFWTNQALRLSSSFLLSSLPSFAAAADAFVVFLPRVVFVKIIAVAVAVQLFVAVPLYWPFHYFVWQYLLHYLLLCLHQVVHFEEVLCATQIGCLYRQFRYHPYHCFYTPFAAI